MQALYWNEDKKWKCSDFSSLLLVCFTYYFCLLKSLLRNCPSLVESFWMTPFLNRASTFFVSSKHFSVDIFVWYEIFSKHFSNIISTFRPDTHFKISGLLINFSQYFTKYCCLPTKDKSPTFTFGNKFCTIGSTSFNWCIGIISGIFLHGSGRGIA